MQRILYNTLQYRVRHEDRGESMVLCSTGWYFVALDGTVSHFLIWPGSLLHRGAFIAVRRGTL